MYPLNRLTDIMIRFIELLEAEGKLAKVNSVRIGQALAMIIVGAGSAIAGLIVLGVAMFLALWEAGLQPSVSALLVGLGFIAVTGGLMYWAVLHVKDVQTREDLP